MVDKTNVANTLRVNLNAEVDEHLQKLKQFFGIQSDSDMIRFLINDKWHEIDLKMKKVGNSEE